MNKVLVKICGITSIRDLRMAVDAGADFIGLVTDVPQSPRNLSIRKSKELMRATPESVESVIVTVPRDLDHLKKIYGELSPEIIQVHGSVNHHEEIRRILGDTRLIGTLQLKPDFSIDTVVKAASTFDAVLLDSFIPGKHGGTGITHDWNLSKNVRDVIYPKPLILAGGLRPENVKEAIRTVMPYAVDVASGVELRPSVKDREKVFEFIKNAREVEF